MTTGYYGRFAKTLEDEGIRIRSSTFLIPEFLAPEGCWTKRKPAKEELPDIESGMADGQGDRPAGYRSVRGRVQWVGHGGGSHRWNGQHHPAWREIEQGTRSGRQRSASPTRISGSMCRRSVFRPSIPCRSPAQTFLSLRPANPWCMIEKK